MIEKFLILKFGGRVTGLFYRGFILFILLANVIAPVVLNRESYVFFVGLHLAVLGYMVPGQVRKFALSRRTQKEWLKTWNADYDAKVHTAS